MEVPKPVTPAKVGVHKYLGLPESRKLAYPESRKLAYPESRKLAYLDSRGNDENGWILTS